VGLDDTSLNEAGTLDATDTMRVDNSKDSDVTNKLHVEAEVNLTPCTKAVPFSERVRSFEYTTWFEH
jgi:hypothetical protein